MPSFRERLANILLPEARSLTVTQALKNLYSGNQTISGLRVTEQNALQVIDVATAVKILAESFAQVPLKVYRKGPDGQREEASRHPVFKLLHDAPNPEMTSFAWRELMMAHLATWGNAYCQIERNGLNEVRALWPLLPDRTHPMRRKDGKLYYKTRGWLDGKERDLELDADEVLHIPGMGWDGMKGYSVIHQIREGVALSSAYQQMAARFFANDATPGFMLSTEQALGDPAFNRLQEQFTEDHGGLRNKFKPYILEKGLKPVNVQMPLEDAQFLESRKFERWEILGFYRIPPHMAGDTEKSSSWGTGISEMTTGFIRFTMDPWFVRAEQAINLKLLHANAQGPLFCEFDREGFERGAFKERMEGYKNLWSMGVVSNVQIAKMENLPPPPTELWLVPNSVISIKQVEPKTQKEIDAPDALAIAAANPKPDAKPKPDDGEGRAALMRAQRHTLVDVVDRIMRRERQDVSRLVERNRAKPDDLAASLEVFYKEHRDYARKQLLPAVYTFADAIRADVSRETGKDVPALSAFSGKLSDSVALRIAEAGRDELRKAVVARVDPAWSRAAEDVVEREVVQVGNALARQAYKSAGVKMVRWVARDACEDCQRLDARTVAVDNPFAMRENKPLGHPPLCDECSCVLVSADVAEGRDQEEGAEVIQIVRETLSRLAAEQQTTNTVANALERAMTPPNIVVNVPEAPAPVVNVTNDVKTPSVTVTNDVKTPDVHVANDFKAPDVTVAAPSVTVQNSVPVPEVRIENNIDTAPRDDIEIAPAGGGKLKITRTKKRKDS